MGFYRERVLPRLHDRTLDRGSVRRVRDRACAPLHGTVVEVGFGSGLNLAHYPPAVTRVQAIEPSAVARRLAQSRIAATTIPVDIAGLDGQRLELPDASVDCALLMLTLCSIPDQLTAARELHRVLVPGGFVSYAEHGASPDAAVARWQHRLNGLNRRVSGCRLDTPTPAVLRSAGFELSGEHDGYLAGAPRWSAYLYAGIARKAA